MNMQTERAMQAGRNWSVVSIALLLQACSADAAGSVDGTANGSSDAGGSGEASGSEAGSGEVSFAQAVFEPEGSGFFRMPWPSDARLRADGTVELGDFPRARVGVLSTYRRAIEGVVHGFSTMPVIYLPLTAGLSGATLPSELETMSAGSPLRLMRLDAAGCGPAVPLESQIAVRDDLFLPLHTVQAAPVPGYALEPATTYGAWVLRDWGGGRHLDGSPAFAEAMAGSGEVAASLSRLGPCLAAQGLTADDLAVATVFTTADPVAETRALYAAVTDPAQTAEPEVTAFARSEAESRPAYEVWLGDYQTPIFMEGQTPFTAAGGAISFGQDGRPAVVRYESVPFSIMYPAGQPGPFPVLVWIDGTGADQRSHLRSKPAQRAIERGFAVVNFQPQFHSGRSGPAADEVFSTFNYTNPTAGRNVFRQQVADTSYFVRLLEQASTRLPGIPGLDLRRLVYGGQSQGADVGALVAGVDPRFVAFGFNGVGAYLSMTIVERTDPVDIAQLIQGLVGTQSELDRFHPIVQLAQLGADVVDPHNYARWWRGWQAHPAGTSVYMTNGFNDNTTPWVSMNALLIAGDGIPISPAGWDFDPSRVWQTVEGSLPMSGERLGLDGTPQTIAMYMDGATGHFTIYEKAPVMASMADFWLSALSGTPTIPDF
jgi:hypothetical protein